MASGYGLSPVIPRLRQAIICGTQRVQLVEQAAQLPEVSDRCLAAVRHLNQGSPRLPYDVGSDLHARVGRFEGLATGHLVHPADRMRPAIRMARPCSPLLLCRNRFHFSASLPRARAGRQCQALLDDLLLYEQAA